MNRLWFIVAIVLCTTSGELLLKHGMNQLGQLSLEPRELPGALLRIFTTPVILAGFGLIFGASLGWLALISRVPLSYAYPMLAMGYVVVMLQSWLLLGEELNASRIAGTIVILLGVILVARS